MFGRTHYPMSLAVMAGAMALAGAAHMSPAANVVMRDTFGENPDQPAIFRRRGERVHVAGERKPKAKRKFKGSKAAKRASRGR